MTQPLANYGSDFWIGPNSTGQLDADPSMRTITGRYLLSQSLCCRFSTARGSAIDCPNDCLDTRDYISAGMTPSQINALVALMQQEASKDQRITSVTATGVFNPAKATLNVTLSGTSLYGPFSFVLAVSQVTVQILNANLPQSTSP